MVRAELFQFTTEPLVNPAPFTVMVNAAPPAVAVEGLSDVSVGAALLTVKGEVPECSTARSRAEHGYLSCSE